MTDRPTIITLTAIPPRFAALDMVLQSLLAQDLSANAIELIIPRSYRRFPTWDGTLPDVPAGVTIRRCDQDLGPATKIVPALAAYADQDVDLLWCDDDGYYPPGWHRQFKAVRRTRPNDALVSAGRHLPGVGSAPRPHDIMPRMQRIPSPDVKRHRATHGWRAPVPLVKTSGYCDLLAGWGGVMVRPSFFSPRVFDGPGAFWPVDDPWLSAMLTLHGTKIWADAQIIPPGKVPSGRIDALFFANFDGQGRDALDEACIAHYQANDGLWSGASLLPDPVPTPRGAGLMRRLGALLPGRHHRS